MSALFKAMLDVQKKIKNAPKDSKNPHFKNDYASLESVLATVKPLLNDHGLILIQSVHPGKDPGTIAVKTNIVHAETGEGASDELTMPLAKSDPQGVGSAITYGRRYGLQAMLGIASEDDDGQSAAGDNKPTPKAEVTNYKKPEPADPKAVEAMTQKLNNSLGFKPSAKATERK